MQRLGFIHDMMDVKVLILFVASRANYPMTTQEIYELCYQDEANDYYVDKNEAALAYAAGADGIYLYNYSDVNHERFDTLGSPETVGSVDPNYVSDLKLYDGRLAGDTMKYVTREAVSK